MSPHSTRLTSARRSPIQFGRAVYTVEQVRLSAGLPPFTVLIDVGSFLEPCTMSLTNDMGLVMEELWRRADLSFPLMSTLVIYRDSERRWDGVEMLPGYTLQRVDSPPWETVVFVGLGARTREDAITTMLQKWMVELSSERPEPS